MNRRTMMSAAALAVVLVSIERAAADAAADEVAALVERLRRTMIDVDAATLNELFAEKLTYGHSDGRVQNKAEVMASLVEKKSVFNSIELGRQTVTIAGDLAVVRHRFVADAVSNGKPSKPDIAVLQVWQKQDGRWRLLVRQAHV